MPLLFFVLVVIVVAIYAHRNKDRRKCRWRQSSSGSKGALIKYNCISCGAKAFRSAGIPDRCMAGERPPRL